MPVSVQWFDNEHKIALYDFEGHWVLEELACQLKAHASMGKAQPEYYIVDMSDTSFVPGGFIARQESYTQFFHLKTGLTVIVNAPYLAVTTIKILKRLGIQLHDILFVDTVEEAVKAIKQHQQSSVI